jgi:DNA-directed RNA polymerase beta' subunit
MVVNLYYGVYTQIFTMSSSGKPQPSAEAAASTASESSAATMLTVPPFDPEFTASSERGKNKGFTAKPPTIMSRVELKALQFCMRSYDEIVAASAFQLTSNRLNPGEYGTVCDPRGGATKNSMCETCLCNEIACPGHFGHVIFDSPILHPLFVSNAACMLRIICARCHRLVVNKHRISYEGLDNVHGARRLERLGAMADVRGSSCVHCDTPVSQYTTKDYNPKPGSTAPKTTFIHRHTESERLGSVDTPMTDADVAEILEDIPDEDVALIGVDPKLFLVRAWPVIPLRCTKQNESGTRVDDIITLLRDMVKLNAIAANPESTDLVRIMAQLDLREKLNIYISNSECRKSSNADRGKPIDGINDRIKGKHGLIRNNLMGKRSVMTARTVIGPDPTLKIDEVSFSRELAKSLTVPMTVHAGNLEECKQLVRRGCVPKLTRDGRQVNLELMGPEKTAEFELQPGDVLSRNFTDGDWVMMNRQPTLHRGSMIALKARLRDTKTFGLNLAITKSFNADFDGDNMNGMIPQSVQARVELAELSSVYSSMIVGTRANVCIVQDALTGAYLMSMEHEIRLPRATAYEILYAMVGDEDVSAHVQRLDEHRERLGKKWYDPRMLISLAFPARFSFTSRDGDFCVERGLLVRGALSKKYLGANGTSLLKVLMFRYGPEECGRFVDRIQFGAINYLSWRGFSVSSDDFSPAGAQVTETVERTLEEAQKVATSIRNKRLRDAKIQQVLNTAKDMGMALVKNATKASNIAVMIDSGSKGDYFNVGQIRGTLGQQNLDGGFIVPQMNGGKRSTIHYHIDEKRPEKLFESRGFIASSFSRGLSPHEIVFHAMTGREGVCTSATLTAVSGYTARRVNKFCEDMVVRIDGSVGDRSGCVYDFAYGGFGMSPAFEQFDYSHIIEELGGEVAEPKQAAAKRHIEVSPTGESCEANNEECAAKRVKSNSIEEAQQPDEDDVICIDDD